MSILEIPIIHDGKEGTVSVRSDLLSENMTARLQDLFVDYSPGPIVLDEVIDLFQDALEDVIDINYYEGLGEDDQLFYLVGAIQKHFGPQAPDPVPEQPTVSPWADFPTDGMMPN